jgi:hypothetical protein
MRVDMALRQENRVAAPGRSDRQRVRRAARRPRVLLLLKGRAAPGARMIAMD